MSKYFNLNYSQRNSDGDNEIDVTINFENPPSTDEIAKKVNIWLNAAGYGDLIVTTKSKVE